MRQYLSFLVISTVILFSCNKASNVGGDILEVDDLETKVTMEIPINAKTIIPDATTTYIRENVYDRHFLGKLYDPIFGESKAILNAQFILPNFSTEFDSPKVDSVVLVMELDTNELSGEVLNEDMDIYAYPLDEQLSRLTSYESDQEIMAKPNSVGNLNNFSPIGDSMVIRRPREGEIDTITLPYHLRIPMEMSFGEQLLSYDKSVYTGHEEFLQKFMGLQLRAENAEAMLPLNLRSENTFTALNIYYKEDTVPKVYSLSVRQVAVAFNTIEHEYKNTPLYPFINNYKKGDSLLFMQGLAGVEIEVELPDLSALEGKIINFAELRMNYADIEDGDPYTDDIDVMTLTQEVEEDYFLVPDAENAENVYISTGNRSDIQELFGGYSQREDSVKYVNFNIPVFLQDIMKNEADPTFRIRPRSKSTTADRSIFYGPGHSEYPMSLKVIYTEQK